MPSFPTTLSEAKDLVNSWSPLGLWSNDATDGPIATGQATIPGPSSPSPITTHSSRLSPAESTPSAIETLPASGDAAPNSPAPATNASQPNVKIMVSLGDKIQVRREAVEKEGSSRPRRYSSDSRRLSIASGATGRSSDGIVRRRGVLETYIIVKPPAATAKHPLNLQIQLLVRQSRPLVPPQGNDQSHPEMAVEDEPSRAPTPMSLTSDDPGAVPMSRSPSDAVTTGEDARSPRDVSSRQRRAGSIKSTLSSDTNASSQLGISRKRVEPMFNLTVHSVMQPTVVTDAATDAKVAKFLKRSVDILGVGSLEPIEFWVPQKDPAEHYPPNSTPITTSSSASHHRFHSTDPASSSPRHAELTRSTENLRLSAPAERSSKRHSIDISTLRVEKGAHEGTTKKLLGRLFKKRTGNASPQSLASVGAPPNAGSSGSSHLRLSRHSSRSSHANSPVPAISIRPPGVDETTHFDGIRQATAIGQATFGTSPLIASAAGPTIEITSGGAIGGLGTVLIPDKEHHRSTTSDSPPKVEAAHPFPLIPSSRALGYSWTLQKWAKKRTDVWAAQLASLPTLANRRDVKPWEDGTDEIIFEWIKVRLTPEGLPPEISKQLLLAGAKPTIVNTARAAQLHSIPMRQPSLSTNSTAHEDERGSIAHSHGHDSDSQTSNSISRASVAGESESASDHTYDSGGETDPEDSETPWTCSLWVRRTGERIALATLTPAPHHPKVIGVLKIPIGLKSVNLGFEGPRPPRRGSDDTVGCIGLSEENLKDVICVTAMWVVAREEFGGIGRRRRV